MEGKRFIHSLQLSNFLSYEMDAPKINLQPLNVLIGPNASGKSNFIEAIGLLRAAPQDLSGPISRGGGIREWRWKGKPESSTGFFIAAVVAYPEGIMPLNYTLSVYEMNNYRYAVFDFVSSYLPIENETEDFYFYRFDLKSMQPIANVRTDIKQKAGTNKGRTERKLEIEDLDLTQSILSQRKDPDQYPEITYLGEQFAKMRLYRDWNLGRNATPRLPQPPDLPNDFLLEDASNLALVLNDLQHRSNTKQIILQKLQQFYEGITDVTTKIQGGTVQLFLHEKGLDTPTPGTRISDGTLRYLCLLTILCHPTPPPLICIEEPELGLHPDILPTIAELLVDASQRTQLIVTTHSDALVSALSHVPEAILVCEHVPPAGSQLRRLEPEKLQAWLENYSLGELWQMGELGGTRW